MGLPFEATRALLLRRRGLLFAAAAGDRSPRHLVVAVGLELAKLGFVPSERLEARLAELGPGALGELRAWACGVLAETLGAGVQHQPLFRSFPEGVPDDTADLWWRKVLSHFLQTPDQPCLFCRQVGTTHVLNPCRHVVCDRCFDGSSYEACPVCEHHVDLSSPFFELSAAERRALPDERVTYHLLDLGDDLDAEARTLFTSFCGRKQVMSPTDTDDLVALVRDYGERVLPWLPPTVPVKENVAAVFGALFRACGPAAVLPAARAHLRTATDVLRLIAAYSGASPSLVPQAQLKVVERVDAPSRWWGKVAALLGAAPPSPAHRKAYIPMQVHRFRVAPLSRPLRRALLDILEGFPADRLTEDLLRHRSYWVWLGQFLHPHEHADRFPAVARAFAVARTKGPDGAPAPRFTGYYGRLEAAAAARDATAMLRVLCERPGELARRLDHVLRVAGRDAPAVARALEAFRKLLPALSTPVLLTLRSHLPTRVRRAAARVYWPKSMAAKGVFGDDARALLADGVVAPTVAAIEGELLRRFAALPPFDDCVVDLALRDVAAPFNERTASRAAVALPRGSRVPVPPGKVARLFLHWCQPERDGEATDLDLSVGLYDAQWKLVGVCSYYQLKVSDGLGEAIATSSGDLRDAPFPDGASEFVDLHRERARAAGVRYAVMVVNAYAGMPFSQLERGFAGLALRDDPSGRYFDPRTVELRFDLQGQNGVFLPLVFDLAEDTLHWLDVYAKGQFQFNNVATSSAAITTVCPTLMEYFRSGARTSMYDLALLHAAARGQWVVLRGARSACFMRGQGEAPEAFLARLRSGAGAEPCERLPAPGAGSSFAALFDGDVDHPATVRYVLFPGKVSSTVAASDLIA